LKGQYIGMVTLFVFLFIVTGNVFGAILFQEEYSERAEYSVGGFNTIAEAQIRGKMYDSRMEKELNYSSNIVALQQGEKDRRWESAPSHQEVIDSYSQAVASELKSQSGLVDCSPPEIGSVSVEDNSRYTASFSDPFISCSTEGTESQIKLSEEQLEIQNFNNSYFQLSKVGVEMAEHIDEKDLPDSWESGTASSSTQADSPFALDKEGTDRRARQKAESDAVQNDDLQEEVISDFETPEWVDLETDVEYRYRVLDTDNEQDSFTYTVCDNRNDEGECTNEREVTVYTYNSEYEVEVTDIIMKYDLADRKEIEVYKDPRKALEDGDVEYSDFDIDYETETRRSFRRWENGELTTEEVKEQIDGFEIPREELQRERKVLDSNAVLQTLHFKFDYIHEIN
jgi:hypothetical protein